MPSRSGPPSTSPDRCRRRATRSARYRIREHRGIAALQGDSAQLSNAAHAPQPTRHLATPLPSHEHAAEPAPGFTGGSGDPVRGWEQRQSVSGAMSSNEIVRCDDAISAGERRADRDRAGGIYTHTAPGNQASRRDGKPRGSSLEFSARTVTTCSDRALPRGSDSQGLDTIVRSRAGRRWRFLTLHSLAPFSPRGGEGNIVRTRTPQVRAFG